MPAAKKNAHRATKVPDPVRRLVERTHLRVATSNHLSAALFTVVFGHEPRARFPTQSFDALTTSASIGLARRADAQNRNLAHPHAYRNAIDLDGWLNLNALRRVDADADADAKEFAAYRLAPGDFLLNARNSRELVGKTAIYTGDGSHLFTNIIMRVRFQPAVLPWYMLGYFHSPAGKADLEQRKSGTTSAFAVYAKSLNTMLIPIPPLDLQCRYEQAMLRILALRTKAQAAVETAEALQASLLAELIPAI